MKFVTPALSLCVLAGTASAQAPIHEFVGSGSGSLPGFGYSVAGGGDIDGDGVPDVVVGAPYEGFQHGGQVSVFSGVDGEPIFPPLSPATAQYYGFSVAIVGDVDGDLHDDILIGDPQLGGVGPGGKGVADVRSGLDGSILFHFEGLAASDQYGWSVSAAGDVDLDAVPDFAIGAVEDHFGPGPGYVELRSGADGSLIRRYSGTVVSSRYGQSMAGAGDVNGDGSADLLVGVSGSNRVEMRSGADGSLLWQAVGPSNLGWDVDAAGDVDADGNPDVVIGAPFSSLVQVRRASSGALVKTILGPSGDFYGGAVAGLGDVDDDGHSDLLIGAKWADSPSGTPFVGAAWIVSGRDQSSLRSFFGTANGDRVGFSAAPAGDVDGDGFPDAVIGANQETNGGPGFVLVVDGRPPLVGDGTEIPHATGGSQPFSLDAGPELAGDTYFLLGSATGTAPGLPVGNKVLPLVYDGYTQFTLANPNSFVLANSFGVLDGDGRAAAQLTLPAGLPPAAIGAKLWHAHVTIRPGTGQFTLVSNPVDVTIDS